MKAKSKPHKLLSMLLALVMVVGLLPTGLFVIEAQAADTVTYDSTPANFTYERGTSNTEELTDDYLMVRGYKGAATAAQIPESVSVDDAGLSDTVVQEYKDAGVTTLDVVGVRSHFSSRTELTHIRLGVNIEYLYSSAFTALADTLVDVDIPENSKLKTIWSDVFAGSMTGGTALERIGITTADGTKTYKLPASVSSIHNYAFYHTSNLQSIDLSLTSVVDLPDSTFSHSGISSIVLPANLKYTGWSVFNGCRNLTTLTLPETMEYIGPYCFQDCISLNKLVLRCGVANIGENLGGAFYSMWGINPDCTVYVPQPANQTDYNKVLSLFYNHMGASASVKLRWLDSSYNEMSISPQTAPAVSSSSVVTLSGTYNGAAYSGFTYDYQDSNNDGLGGVIVLDGKLTNDLTLKLNGAYAGNTTQVVWHKVDAYVNCQQIYSVDSAATRYADAYVYRYPSFDAGSMIKGETKELTLKAFAEDGGLLQVLTVTVTAVDPECPYYIGFSSDYGYYNLGLYDYSGTGWTWNKNSLQLTLDGYSSSSSITCGGGPLNLRVQSDSSLGIINAINGLKITGSPGSTLTVNNTQRQQDIKGFEKLEEIITEVEQTEITGDAEPTDIPQEQKQSSRNLTPLFEANGDCIGWICIPNTAVNYPVMFTPEEPQKYLRKNFEGEYSVSGVPFLDGASTPECDNLIVYGHNMKNGTMFSDITQYRDKAYFEEHPYIEFETADGLKIYQVFAVVCLKKTDLWYNISCFESEEHYQKAITEIKDRSLYDTGIEPQYKEHLITLSTCFGDSKDSRMVVIGVEQIR